ncbi:uncharacterized [Tachysurus ichikawai]
MWQSTASSSSLTNFCLRCSATGPKDVGLPPCSMDDVVLPHCLAKDVGLPLCPVEDNAMPPCSVEDNALPPCSSYGPVANDVSSPLSCSRQVEPSLIYVNEVLLDLLSIHS